MKTDNGVDFYSIQYNDIYIYNCRINHNINP